MFKNCGFDDMLINVIQRIFIMKRMIPHKSGWETSAAFVCYKQATIAEKVLQHVTVVPGLRDPVVIQRATREAANNDEMNDSSTWWTARFSGTPRSVRRSTPIFR